MFGKKKLTELEAALEDCRKELAIASEQLDKYGAMDAIELEAAIRTLNDAKAGLQAELASIKLEIEQEKAHLVETNEQKILQDVGIYEFSHPLSKAVQYEDKLKKVREARKAEIRRTADSAAQTDWTVKGSAAEGRKMVKQTQRLMTEAYNAALENSIRTLKPFTLERAIERMDKTRERISKNGQVLGIAISEKYHQLSIEELELTADYLVKKEDEKEALRAEKEREREERQAQKEFEAEKKRLQKEKDLHLKALAKMAVDRAEERAELEAKISQLDNAIHEVEEREANIRTGFVYVISNVGSFGPDVIKVGLTRRLDPNERVRELGDASVPFKFDVHAIIFSHDAVTLERELHTRLGDFRVNAVNQRREFFYATPDQVRMLVEQLGTEFVLDYEAEVEAYEWHESGGAERRAEISSNRESLDASLLPDEEGLGRVYSSPES